MSRDLENGLADPVVMSAAWGCILYGIGAAWPVIVGGSVVALLAWYKVGGVLLVWAMRRAGAAGEAVGNGSGARPPGSTAPEPASANRSPRRPGP